MIQSFLFFCLDWVKGQLALQQRIRHALKANGKVLYVICTGKDECGEIVEDVIHSTKWQAYLADYNIPAGLHSPEAYQQFLPEAGFVIDEFEVVHFPDDFLRFHIFFFKLSSAIQQPNRICLLQQICHLILFIRT